MTLAPLLAKKALLVLAITLLVASCSFWAVHLLPDNLALQIAAARFAGAEPDQALADVVSASYGLDRPVIVQYGEWLVSTLMLDFGTSLVSGRDVMHDIVHHGVNSLRTVFWGFIAGVGLAVPIGFFCARKPGSKLDVVLSAISAGVSTIPAFLVAIVMVQIFVVELGLATLSGTSGWSRLWVMILTIALSVSGPLSRVVRTAVIDVRQQPYMQHALMRGVPERQLFWRHGLKNAIRPMLNYLPVVFMFLIYDVIVIEMVFNYHGLGWALINAVKALDVPLMQGLVLSLIVFYLFSTALAEILTWQIYRQRVAQ
ncbi:ABC transporter permease [Phaeobacter inhibens]|uniref:ABC transporter permease n=1 Tax=Phaeobacter inhibens TaxID=221822 RepID=UPI000C9A9DC0|nr:ABC transporter permease [Phaeobacter inhibens]AUQ55126.1 ABC transporter, permease protein [Phaeobacter inhibens]AUQ79142.1 ABC transporter, permease protein [Phaeobacter inhibens]AUR16301.1 ABC transporter, permease protein [Phaeobacter inhibens]UWR91406.1 ABC transporter permease [Phaeobacter inhibens]